jgi:hypothetical protein
LPKKIVVPIHGTDNSSSYLRHWHAALLDLADAVSDRVEVERQDLQNIPPFMFTVLVDEFRVAIDACDLGQAQHLGHYDYVFKKACMSEHEHYRNVGSCPIFSFPDWKTYWKLAERIDKVQPRLVINYRDADYPNDGRPGLTARRRYVRGLLTKHFGDRVETKLEAPLRWFDRVLDSLVTVHSGGCFNNMADRTSIEVMGLARCLIQPTMFCILGDRRPRPGDHYVECWDDFSDLVEKCQWYLDHPEEAMAIGARARQFFLEEITPENFWARVLRCCREGR